MGYFIKALFITIYSICLSRGVSENPDLYPDPNSDTGTNPEPDTGVAENTDPDPNSETGINPDPDPDPDPNPNTEYPGQEADRSQTEEEETKNEENKESDDETKINEDDTEAKEKANEADKIKDDDDSTNPEDGGAKTHDDGLVDTPKVLGPDSIGMEASSSVHTMQLMLYIIAPVSALVVIYFIMKGLRGHSRNFLTRYHTIGTRADSIELRPLGCESEEEDIVYDRN